MKIDTKKLTFISFCISINIVGSFLAFLLKLPIYLDSIGTVFISLLYGPFAGALTGALSSATSGMIFDVYSFYFIPVQIVLGILMGLSKNILNRSIKQKVVRVFLISIPISLLGAIVVTLIFDGVTSSGSAYIVQFLRALGLKTITSVFITQFITDFLDKLFATFLADKIINSKSFRYII
ncbi:energy-coupling factor transport system substrate-specific component [Anaerosphaera aminiphila DSM 21120]|uniref:Energy-coupling factor transport system substrate-specific component n=1 Tax=Anaerosphaera aminiphila DSM 21120 TaxID=1120995 RepID=A0A1M5UPX7_9FIRM|nr:ECF transporter S component [Anaerosphaera aminiphila]SHH64936.1 energy-coupling factor transport system substrate-specific component [Anaerosphaera aminiphila DSM 21120]